MIALLARLAIGAGVSKEASRAVAIAVIGAVILAAIAGAILLIRHGGETAGAAKVTAKVEKAHTARVAEARADERAAATVTQSIADRTVRIDRQTDDYVQKTIKDLRDALAAVPLGAGGAALPAAPVDRVRDNLNAGIDRANRAADAADATP